VIRAAISRRSVSDSSLPGRNPVSSINSASEYTCEPVTRKLRTVIFTKSAPATGGAACCSMRISGAALGATGDGGICCIWPPAEGGCCASTPWANASSANGRNEFGDMSPSGI